MKRKKIIVKKKIESHEVADVVFNANKYKSKVYLKTGQSKFNIKSLMGMFALKVEPEMEILLEADGEDEREALEQMATVFE